jgi:hypothetical protein
MLGEVFYMEKNRLFYMYLFMNAVRYGWLLMIGIIVTIIGAFWIDSCLYIGLGLIILYLMICLVLATRLYITMNRLSNSEPEFNEIMEKLAEDLQ